MTEMTKQQLDYLAELRDETPLIKTYVTRFSRKNGRGVTNELLRKGLVSEKLIKVLEPTENGLKELNRRENLLPLLRRDSGSDLS